MPNRRRFKNYFPEPRIQLKFLGLLVGGALAQITVTASVLYYFLNENYTLLVKYAVLDEQIAAILTHEMALLVKVIVTTFVLFLIGLTALGVSFSHRIAGPLYALRRTITDINSGKANARLKLRTGDEFMELQDNFNKMVDKLSVEAQARRQA